MSKFKFLPIGCLLVSILITMSTGRALAQNVELGVRLMPTVSSMKLNSSSGGSIKGEATLGFGAGAMIGFLISEHVSIQVEAIYNSLNQKYKEQEEERNINLRYFNIPLLVALNTGKLKTVNFSVVAGPQLGFSAGSSITAPNKNNPDTNEPTLSVKKGDFGFAYGAGFDFALNSEKSFRLGIGYRGVIGLIDISDDSNTTITDSYYVLEKTTIRTHSAYVGLSIQF